MRVECTGSFQATASRFLVGCLTLCWVAISATAAADPIPLIEYDSIFHPEMGRYGMVVSQEQRASQVGADILGQGGNAVDAAVATGFALAVTLPRAGNLGGGGFMLIHLKDKQQTIALDYREIAPAGASHDMYLDDKGEVDKAEARFSHRSSGVPGTVAGLLHAQEKYGRLPREQVMAPAIAMARTGILVTPELASSLNKKRDRFLQNKEAAKLFIKEDGSFWRVGDTWRQPELAQTLQLIADQGSSAFYRGSIAKKIVAEMQTGNGLITLQDLRNYQVVERQPVTANYHGVKIASMPPPSSGGIHLVQMLEVLKHFPLAEWGMNSADSVHVMVEAMRLAYADRSKYLGDPDFYEVPQAKLLSETYIKNQVARINSKRATPSSKVAPGELPVPESPETTHFSIMDNDGNAVSNTYTLNFSFGSGIAVPGTGFLLNNEMDDFSSKPGVPNAFGLLGGEANAIEPRKRPLSSMSPTIAFKEGKPWLVTGSPGGSHIITVVLQVLLNTIDHGQNIAAATNQPRFHHQWWPDTLYVEPGFPVDTTRLLQERGHSVQTRRALGSTQSIVWENGVFYGAADPRRPGSGAVGVMHLQEQKPVEKTALSN